MLVIGCLSTAQRHTPMWLLEDCAALWSSWPMEGSRQCLGMRLPHSRRYMVRRCYKNRQLRGALLNWVSACGMEAEG
jgi:hypothetical protein